MDPQEARAFVGEHGHAVLSTNRSDGRPQMSPVLAVADDEGRVMISSRETAFKTKNARRDPNVSLCVLSDGFFGDWIQIDGRAEIVSLPAAMELLVDYYRRAQGEHDDWDDYRAAMERDKRCIIRISIERAGPDRSG